MGRPKTFGKRKFTGNHFTRKHGNIKSATVSCESTMNNEGTSIVDSPVLRDNTPSANREICSSDSPPSASRKKLECPKQLFENLNSKPKSIFVGIQEIKLGLYDAVIIFNNGVCGKLKVLKQQSIQTGFNTAKALQNIDHTRVKKADKLVEEMAKRARRLKRKNTIDTEDP